MLMDLLFPEVYARRAEPPVDVVVWTVEPATGKQVTAKKPRQEEFKLELHVPTFKPDELKVNLDGQMLIIEGSHEEKAEDGSYSFQSDFHRRVLVPKEMDLDSLKTSLDDKGILTIEARPKTLEPKKELKSIPIGLKTTEEEKKAGSS